MYQQKSCRENLIVKTKIFINFKLLKMNLENLNLVQLSTKEVEETEGGFILELTLAIGLLPFALGFYVGYHNP